MRVVVAGRVGCLSRGALRLWVGAGAVLLTVAGTPVAAAQSRTTMLRASAVVVGAPGSDLLSAESVIAGAISPAGGSTSVRARGDTFRIRGSRGQQLSIQVESGQAPDANAPAAVAICQSTADVARASCREHRLSSVRVTTVVGYPEVTVRVERLPDTGRRAGPAAPVLVTIAYITG